jgi:hypothetical protein
LGGGGREERRGEEEVPLRNTNLVIALFDWPITKIIYQKEKKKIPLNLAPLKEGKNQCCKRKPQFVKRKKGK